MTDEGEELLDQPLSGARQYQIVGAAGLLVMTLPLFARGVGVWCLLPLLVGVLTGLLTWRGGPYLVLLSLLFLVFCDRWEVTPVDIVANMLMCCSSAGRANLGFDHGALGWDMEERVPLLDAVMAVGLLAYLMAAFRLLGLQKNILPVDPRRRVRASTRRQEARVGRLPPPKPQVRSESLVQPKESFFILLAAIVTAVIALIFGLWLRARNVLDDLYALEAEGIELDVNDATWQLIVLIWLVGLVLLVLSGALAYVGMLRRGPEEAQLFLQDQLWKETRREQSRIARWMAWAALDARRHEPVKSEATPTPAATPAQQGRTAR